MKNFLPPCVKNFNKKILCILFISLDQLQAEVELSQQIAGPQGQILLQISVHNSDEKALFEPQLCTANEHQPKVCYQGSKALIAGGKKESVVWRKPSFNQELRLSVQDLFGEIVATTELKETHTRPSLIGIASYSAVKKDNRQHVHIEVMVHQAPINIAIQTKEERTMYQQAFLSTGLKHIHLLSKELPSHVVYAGLGDENAVRQTLTHARGQH